MKCLIVGFLHRGIAFSAIKGFPSMRSLALSRVFTDKEEERGICPDTSGPFQLMVIGYGLSRETFSPVCL